MPKYLIERRLPKAGELSPEELRTISQQSNSVLREMTQDGKQVQWLPQLRGGQRNLLRLRGVRPGGGARARSLRWLPR
jgi:hypothetical protein